MAVIYLPVGSLLYFDTSATSTPTWVKITEHNRQPLSVQHNRIEKIQRTSNGTLRKFFIADKRTFSTSWGMLPSYTTLTVDGGYGAVDMQTYYNGSKGQGSFKIKISYSPTREEILEVVLAHAVLILLKEMLGTKRRRRPRILGRKHFSRRGIMAITVDPKVTDAFEKNTSVSMNVGATMDINLNTTIDWDAVTTPVTGNADTEINKRTPFKKLFPIDTMIKPNRPRLAGIRYAIFGDVLEYSYKDPKAIPYLLNYRTYYPSKNTYYKYWVSPKNTNPNVTVSYPKILPTNKVVVKFETSHATPSSWSIYANVSGVATLLKTSSSVQPFTNTVNGVQVPNYDAGSATIYYTGSTWSLSESDLNYSAFVNITSLNITAVNPGGWIGIIEIAPHMVVDLTQDIVSFDLSKEQNSSTEELLPVGYCTANSLDLNLAKYDKTQLQFKTFNRYSLSDIINSSYIYLIKNSQISLYVKVYHADGTNTDSRGTYFKIPQGLFYVDSWTISDVGDVSIFSLDSAKILQESICPDTVCEGYSAIAIIRRVLDSVGFTNYNFNYKESDTSVILPAYWWTSSGGQGENASVTVWENLQDLCRDSQITAFVDEYNVLQFYTREYLFDATKSATWAFRHSPSGTSPNVLLPNIIEFNKKEMPSVNRINIRYKSISLANFQKSSHEILEFTDDSLMAASLISDIPVSANPLTAPSVKHYMGLSIIETGDIDDNIASGEGRLSPNTNTFIPYGGYLLINSEIIEYDAIQYQYFDLSNPSVIKYVDVSSKSDLSKYAGLATQTKVGERTYTTTFAPTNKYRIKTRGALGTNGNVSHSAAPVTSGWFSFGKVVWK